MPILKKGEYDIWAMKMEHYLAHTDYPIWEVIQNGNGPVSITTDTSGQIKVLPPRTAEEIVARERERKARTTLLMALPEDHLAKFHKMTDAKEMWDAIKSRFGGNDESKKMQKYILKQQFEGFSVSKTEGLHKAMKGSQSLLSQLEIHGACVSTEDANQKFLRSLPSAWSQVSLIMRTKPGMDSLSFDDLYNNLIVFKSDVKRLYLHHLLAIKCSICLEYNQQKWDLMWASWPMISMRMKKFYKKTGRKLQFDAKESVGFDKTKVECYNCHKTGHFAREYRIKGNQDNRRRDAWNSGTKDGSRTGQKEDSKALVTIDGEGVDWTNHSEDEDYALMACNSSDSDTEREQLSDASIEIKAYFSSLRKLKHSSLSSNTDNFGYEQKIKFMKIDLMINCVLNYHKKLLAEAQKEKEDLKAKVEKWHNSSKNLSKLLNTQMSANDKFGLGYGDHRYDGILSYENEVLQSVFMNKESELEKQPLYDRFVIAEGMHAVPPPMTGNYMPSGPDIEVDYSQFTYAPKQTQIVIDSNNHNHLIRDCDFHEKRMARKAELNNGWNNVQRVNKQNQFVHSAVLTRTGKIPVSTARASSTKIFSTVRQSFNRQAVPTSTAMKVNTSKPIVNRVRPANVFHKTHSPSSRPFKKTTVLRTDFSKQKVNTAKVNAVSTVGGKGKLLLSLSHKVVNWETTTIQLATISPIQLWDPVLEIDYPHRALKNKGIVDSGCSRHMTGNKAYLAEFQDFNGGPVAFGGSKGVYHEFKNKDVIELCGSKGIKREYSNARTPQQNGVAERKNRTLIEAARTMLADSFLPNTFWAEAVSTACYVLNRVLVTKPHNKTPYELLTDVLANITNDIAVGTLDNSFETDDVQTSV
ncbi:ribonuclease H-like domain-containing protein [Tanacetum coccineum]